MFGLLQVNFFAVLALNQAVAPYMIERRSGLIGEDGVQQCMDSASHCLWYCQPILELIRIMTV
jgi:hypothetical protein